jgi:flagellar motor switch protein FliG
MSAALASPELDLEPGPPPQRLTGAQRAATLLMLLGEEHGRPIWAELSDGEIKQVCLAMADLGSVRPETITRIMADFIADLDGIGVVTGDTARAEELLSKIFPADRVAAIMAEVRGSSEGRQVWRRLAGVPPEILASFLRDEYPQTVAVILSRMSSEHGGRVLALLPDELAVDVVDRMLRLQAVRPEAIENIEEMLHVEFLAKGPVRLGRDPYEVMADRFNVFDRPTEARFLAALGTRNREAAQRVREKMFTFDDVLKLDAASIQTVMRQINKDVLARALKGSSEEARAFFLANMSSRAGKNLVDDIEAMGPIRMKDVDDAQGKIVALAKELADKGEIQINKGRGEEDLVA